MNNNIWTRKIDLLEGKRARVVCKDGDVYIGFGSIPCIGENEDGEEVDAIKFNLGEKRFVVLTEDEIENYEILD